MAIDSQTRLTDGTGIPHLKLGKYCKFKLLDWRSAGRRGIAWKKSMARNEMEPEQKKRFIREWGAKAYELDAIPPLEFEQLIYDSLAEYTDMEVLGLDDELERKWQDKVQKFKEVVTCYAQKEAKKHGLL